MSGRPALGDARLVAGNDQADAVTLRSIGLVGNPVEASVRIAGTPPHLHCHIRECLAIPFFVLSGSASLATDVAREERNEA